MLHFHPDEGAFCCYPSDAEAVYAQYAADWSQFGEELEPKELDPGAPCYYEYWADEDVVQLRYWFWYKYNRFPGSRFGIGNHIGDWEHVEVRVYPDLGVVWLVSNHLSARVTARPPHLRLGAFETEPLTADGDHVHVWVALGSHANYPSPDSRPYCFARVFCDRIADGGAVWDTSENLRPLAETNFASFTGRWGNDKSPRSPTNPYNNRWRNAPRLRPTIAINGAP